MLTIFGGDHRIGLRGRHIGRDFRLRRPGPDPIAKDLHLGLGRTADEVFEQLPARRTGFGFDPFDQQAGIGIARNQHRAVVAAGPERGQAAEIESSSLQSRPVTGGAAEQQNRKDIVLVQLFGNGDGRLFGRSARLDPSADFPDNRLNGSREVRSAALTTTPGRR
jgi:hypothetical protein